MIKSKTYIKILIISLALLILSDGLILAVNKKESFLYQTGLHFSYDPVISRAGKFYQNKPELSIDEFYLLKKISEKDNTFLNYYDSYDLKIYKNNPFLKMINSDFVAPDLNVDRKDSSADEIKKKISAEGFYLANNFYSVKDKYSGFLKDPWDDIMLKSLYCDVSGYDDLDFEILKLLRNGDGGYMDTHFLLGLIFLKQNGCYEEDKIEEEINSISKTLVDIQDLDQEFSDLYVERVAFLYWAGKGDEVKKEWADKIKENFNKEDNRWIDSNKSDAHVTGLSILSLALFVE